MSSATERVLAILELLEQIIILLPPWKVCSVQYVSKKWRDAIVLSTALQERMFRKLLSNPVESSDYTSWNHTPDQMAVPEYDEELDLSPMPYYSRPNCSIFRHDGASLVSHYLIVNADVPTETFEQSNLSYYDMFLTQPPCATAHVNVYYMTADWSNHQASHSRGCSIRDATGLKCRQIVYAARKISETILPSDTNYQNQFKVIITLKMPACAETLDHSEAILDMWHDCRLKGKKKCRGRPCSYGEVQQPVAEEG